MLYNVILDPNGINRDFQINVRSKAGVEDIRLMEPCLTLFTEQNTYCTEVGESVEFAISAKPPELVDDNATLYTEDNWPNAVTVWVVRLDTGLVLMYDSEFDNYLIKEL